MINFKNAPVSFSISSCVQHSDFSPFKLKSFLVLKYRAYLFLLVVKGKNI